MAWQFSPGEILTSVNLNAVTIPWNALCQVRMSTPQSLTNNTITTLLFDTEDLDPRTWHSTSVSTGRITPTIQGWYEAVVDGVFGARSDFTSYFLQVRKNGSDLAPARGISINGAAVTTSPILNANTGLITMNGSSDYVELIGRHVNTATAAVTVDALFKLKLVYPF